MRKHGVSVFGQARVSARGGGTTRRCIAGECAVASFNTPPRYPGHFTTLHAGNGYRHFLMHCHISLPNARGAQTQYLIHFVRERVLRRAHGGARRFRLLLVEAPEHGPRGAVRAIRQQLPFVRLGPLWRGAGTALRSAGGAVVARQTVGRPGRQWGRGSSARHPPGACATPTARNAPQDPCGHPYGHRALHGAGLVPRQLRLGGGIGP